jgi:hypothetical protein
MTDRTVFIACPAANTKEQVFKLGIDYLTPAVVQDNNMQFPECIYIR